VLNISDLVIACISKLENDASGFYQKSLSKKLTTTHKTTAVLDKNFSKDTWTVHPSIISFPTNMTIIDKKSSSICCASKPQCFE
jgi:hypothetical protein